MTKLQALQNIVNVNNAKLHINGDGHPTAFLTVDFGHPNDGQFSLDQEENQRIIESMKQAVYEMSRRRGSVRVGTDTHNGIYWAGFAS